MKKSLLKVYETDASQLKGSAIDVVIPRSVEEVRGIVVLSPQITIRGAGTGLAGGAVPQGDLVLDMSALNKISGFDRERKTVEVEAGVVLDDLQNYLKKYGLEFPVNPSSHSVCTIGGMIATDAVGSRAMIYGKTSNWVKWVEVVDGNGNLHKKGVTELSDYSGMEGITGVIVRACLKLSPLRIRTASLLELSSLEEVESAVKALKRERNVSMIEFIDKIISNGLDFPDAYHLIVEYEDNSGLLGGIEYDKLMKKRDEIYPFLASEGYNRIEDPKIMVNHFAKFASFLERKRVPFFGHLSVGIIHPCFNLDQEKHIPEMMKVVKRLSGSVTGEHGIGLLKKGFVEANDKKIWTNVKKRTDSENKFNRGKVI